MSGTQSHLSDTENTEVAENHQSLNVTVRGGTAEAELEMGEKTIKQPKNKNDVTGKTKKRIREPAPIKEALTTVAHCCVLAFVLLILYLCFKHPFEFFTWHPLLLSLGWMLLMSEAILVISKENVLTQKFKVNHTWRLRWHWVGLTIAAVLIAIGFIVITISKNIKNKYHYTSWHGLLGLIGIITFIPPCINGVATLYGKELKNYLNPKLVKLVHIVTGTLSFACGGLSLILSVYTKWFARNTDSNPYIFLFGLVTLIFPILWIVQRPLIKSVRNINKLFSKDE